MWGWICATLAVVALVAWVVSRSRFYGRVFAADHILDFVRGVAKAKAAALARVVHSEEDHVRSPEDPRVFVSSAGLALIYTVGTVEGRFIHHYSISVAGGI